MRQKHFITVTKVTVIGMHANGKTNVASVRASELYSLYSKRLESTQLMPDIRQLAFDKF